MELYIDEIVKRTRIKYGESCIFHELLLSSIIIDKTLIFYRVKTIYDDPDIYQIQMQVFDKIKQTSSHLLNYFHKCQYCNKRDPNYKFNCCNKYTHLDCASENNFACCHLNCYLNKDISKEKEEKEECCVCLNEISTITKCGHRLCVDCLIEMTKNNNEINCPMCRKIIVDNCDIDNYINIVVNKNMDCYTYSYI